MAADPVLTVSAEEYLYRERLAPFKSEYHRGRVVAMSGASRFHNRIVRNLTTLLSTQLRDRRCQNYANDMRVAVRGGASYFYPDVVVTCGQEEFADDKFDVLLNPVVVIEVLSASTEPYDRGAKFLDYQLIPTLREYALITPSPRRFEIYQRRPDGVWHYQSWAFSPPPLVLESIGCTLTSDEVYFKVEDAPRQERPRDEPEPG